MFLKPFLYLFVPVILVCTGNALAQDVTIANHPQIPADSVAHASDTAVVDTSQIHASDTIASPQKEPPFKSRVKYKATDSITFDLVTKEAFLYKETQVNYEDIEITAYETRFDMDTKVVHVYEGKDSIGNPTGVPHYKEGGTIFDAVEFSYNFGTSKGVIQQVKMQQGEGYMHAEKSKRYPDGHVDMAGGKYTTCDANHPHFYLALSKAKMMPGDKVVFGLSHMVLEDVPLPLFIPFGFFPYTNKKSVSGIIPPTIGMEISRGMNATNGGYYFAFNDHVDATLTGDIYSTGTWGLGLTSRYMTRYKYNGNVNMRYYVNVSGEKGLDQTRSKEYSIRWTHTQDAKAHPNRNFSASVNYSTTSFDKQFNYTSPQNLYTNTKNSSISYRQGWPNSPFRLTANMNHTQNSNDQIISIIFPTASFSMDMIYPFRKKEQIGKRKWYEDVGITYNAELKNTLQGKEGDLFSEKNLKKMQNGFQHSIPLSVNFKVLKFFNITPSLNYRGMLYTSYIDKHYDKDSVSVSGQRGVVVTDTIHKVTYAHSFAPTLSIGATPKFYLTSTSNNPNARIQAVRTVISPEARVSYVPNMDGISPNYYKTYADSTDREYTYSMYEGSVYGTPSVQGQSGNLSVGINGSVEMKVRSTDSTGTTNKIKIIDRYDISSNYNIFADSMRWQPINMSASTTILGTNFKLGATVDPYDINLKGTRYNKYNLRLTRVYFDTGLSFPMNKNNKKDENKNKLNDGYDYFDVPWNVSLTYHVEYNKPAFEGKVTQTLSMSGSVTLTKKWNVGISSGYDFEAKQIAYTNFNITRDLHCWTMSLSFSPFGQYKFFTFLINVKSAMLRDLKYEKRKDARDYTQW